MESVTSSPAHRGFRGRLHPLAADTFADSGLQQLVVLWKPHECRQRQAQAQGDQFIEDAIRYFDNNGIPYLDLYHDERITPSMFAEGDHFNATGRDKVTEILVAKVHVLLGL